MKFKSIIRLIVRILHQDGAKLMELIFCGKRDAQAVLVLYKYSPYCRDVVGICFDLVRMWRRWQSFAKVDFYAGITIIVETNNKVELFP